MKIINAVQMRQLDQYTIQHQRISSWELMERASKKLTERLISELADTTTPIYIFCGKGNNGGDGLAIARLLQERKYAVRVFLLKSVTYSADNLSNQKKLASDIHFFSPSDSLALQENCYIVDALFGVGLHKPLSEEWMSLFAQIQLSNPKAVYAVDLPSGFLADVPMSVSNPCLNATHVFTFQLPKLGLLLPDNQSYFDSFETIPIGLETDFTDSLSSDSHYVKAHTIHSYLKDVSSFAHKGIFGHVLLIGGSLGKMGSVVLSSRAALQSGSGLVSAYVPKCGLLPIQIGLVEGMCLTSPSEAFIDQLPDLSSYKAAAIGMGLGQHPDTAHTLIEWLPQQHVPLVIDADALNILSRQKNPFACLPKNSVLTPHPKELERLIGTWHDDFEKINTVQELARTYQVTFVIKGHHTVIATPEGKCFFNSTGNWGMATAGSGDVLSGIIASLIGQGYQPTQAAVTGVYLHRLAGDLAVKTIHPHSLTASDILNHLSAAYFELEQAQTRHR